MLTSMTTVRADSAVRAIEQIALLVLQSGAGLRRDEVQHYVRSTVDGRRLCAAGANGGTS